MIIQINIINYNEKRQFLTSITIQSANLTLQLQNKFIIDFVILNELQKKY